MGNRRIEYGDRAEFFELVCSAGGVEPGGWAGRRAGEVGAVSEWAASGDVGGLCRRIEEWMDQGWSPKRRSRGCSTTMRRTRRWTVCRTRRHQAPYVQTRGWLRKDLYRQLCRPNVPTTTPGGYATGPPSPCREAFKISLRPAAVAEPGGARPLGGRPRAGNRQQGAGVGTLVERTSRFTICCDLPGRHVRRRCRRGDDRTSSTCSSILRRSVTWDRGIRTGPLPQDPARARHAGLHLRPAPSGRWRRRGSSKTHDPLRSPGSAP